MSLPATRKVPYGAGYNPQQWPEPVWEQDHRLFDAARIDTVALGVVDWALVQPAPDVHDSSTLDRSVRRGMILRSVHGGLPRLAAPKTLRAHRYHLAAQAEYQRAAYVGGLDVAAQRAVCSSSCPRSAGRR
jgi:hypothetical protein